MRVQEEVEQVSINPQNSYYLCTLINNKVYFLEEGEDCRLSNKNINKIATKKEDARIVEFGT